MNPTRITVAFDKVTATLLEKISKPPVPEIKPRDQEAYEKE